MRLKRAYMVLSKFHAVGTRSSPTLSKRSSFKSVLLTSNKEDHRITLEIYVDDGLLAAETEDDITMVLNSL